jgi:multidrug transporter EmrE-like cation transporter
MRFVLLIISAILAAAGQIFLKKSAVEFSSINLDNLLKYFIYLASNVFSWLGIVSYGLSFAIYMVVLNKVNLSIARSFNAISYILVILFSIIIFKDGIGLFKIIGISMITAGIIFISIP